MVVLCGACRGPATEAEVTLGDTTVIIVQCPDCDFSKCPTCKVPIASKHAMKCPYGHRL